MKLIGGVFGILTMLLVGIYLFLFTSLGHGIILPIVEGKIKEATKLENVKFDSFDLGLSSLNTVLMIENNPIKVDADFSLFGKTIDAKYDVNIKELSSFGKLVQAPLKGTFTTQGSVKGKFDDMLIKGVANVAKGDIAYDLNIAGENINNINFTVVDLDLSTLLGMVGQPQYIQGLLQSRGKISSQNLENVDFIANVTNGKINTNVVQKAFKISIPQSQFKLNSKANIANKVGDYIVDIDSSLAKIKSDGKLDMNSMGVDAKYDLLVQSLAMLEPIIGTKFNGAFATNGTVKGDQKQMKIDGASNIASSNTTYHVNLKDSAPQSINAMIKNAQLDQLLYTLNQPKYAKGNLTVDAKISSLNDLKGTVITTINNGLLNPTVVKKEFDIALPNNSTFNSKINTSLNKNLVTSDLKFNSFVANLVTKKTTFQIDTAKLNTDYTLDIPNLAELYFLTNQKMQGDIKVTGDVTFDKKLLATFNSKKFGGTLDGKIDDNKLTVDIKDFQTLPLLDMMYYPQVFKSSLNANLNYDIATKKGLSKVDMANGKFLTNEAMTMLKNLTSYDLTLEVYKVANLTTNIDDNILKNDLFMESEKSTIKSKKFIVDTKKSSVDADINITYRKYDLGIKLDGPLQGPKVSVDPGDVLKQKANKEINKLIDKKLDGKVDDDVKGLLKGLLGK